MLQNLRNAAIVALLALGVTVLPGGGAAAETVLAALLMGFLVAIAALVYRVYREQQMTLMTLTEGQRAILFAAVGLVALLIAGFAEITDWNGGLVIWVALVALAAVAIYRVWRGAGTYT